MDFVRNLYSKDNKNSYNSMKFEDYISGQHIQSSSQAWLMPISKKHTYAILSTAALAICSSFFVSKTQNYQLAREQSYEEVFVNEKGEVIESSPVTDIIDPTQSLAEVLSSHYTKDNEGKSKHSVSQIDNQIVIDTKGEALDNYDDNISEQLLADTDTELDKKIRDKTGTTQSSWFVEDIASGDTLSSVFSDLNIPYATLEAITSNKDAGKALSNLRTGYTLSFLLDEKNNLLAFVKQIDKDTQIRFYRDNVSSNDFTAIKESLGAHLKSKEETLHSTASGVIADNKTDELKAPVAETEEIPLYKRRGRLVLVTLGPGQAFSTAAHESGLTYNEIAKITDLFKGRIQFTRHLQPGDTMRVLFSEDKGEGKINAVEFNLARLGKLSTFRNLGDDKYYDEKGYNSSSGTFRRFPINGKVVISSHFNPNRRHPVTGQYRPHNGTDFAVRIGTPIVAPADGVVDIARYSKGAGYYIVLRHRGNYSTVYMHLSKMNVKPGQRVKAGSVIARSGNTGISTGPHLHYELRINNKPVNAMRVKLPNNSDATVVAKQRKRFENNVAAFKKDLHNEKLIAKLE